MVDNPADYRFCSFGQWSATGRNPYGKAIREHLMPVFAGLLHVKSLKELKIELQKEFAHITAIESEKSPEETETAIATAGEKEPFSRRTDRRVRYWVDGLVIGSDIFVLNTVAKSKRLFGSGQAKTYPCHRFTRCTAAALQFQTASNACHVASAIRSRSSFMQPKRIGLSKTAAFHLKRTHSVCA